MTANTAAGRVASAVGMLHRHAQIIAKRYIAEDHTLYGLDIIGRPDDVPPGATLITDVNHLGDPTDALGLGGNVAAQVLGATTDISWQPFPAPHVATHLSPYYTAGTPPSSVAPLPTRWYIWGAHVERAEYSSPGVAPTHHVTRYLDEGQDILPSVIRLILDVSEPGDIVWDPFLISPKYLVAAAITGRRPCCTPATIRSNLLPAHIESVIAAATTPPPRRYLTAQQTNKIKNAKGTLTTIAAACSPLLTPIERRACRAATSQLDTLEMLSNGELGRDIVSYVLGKAKVGS